MTRRCSHCSNNGHNSRTCPMRAGGIRLFGVRLTEGGSMKKSASMGCLSHYTSLAASPKNALDSPPPDPLRDSAPDAAGYASDDPNHASCSANRRGERKKGTPWTEEEHRMFLVGLQKLGKGDWRGIARNYVASRTPTQVASHAQKYFIRQTNASRRKRRSSLFDMIPDMPMDQVPVAEEHGHHSPTMSENANSLPSLDLTLDYESALPETIKESPSQEMNNNAMYNNIPPLVPMLYPAYIPVPYPFCHASLNMPASEETTGKTHEVLRPKPILLKDSIHADELVGLSKLSLGEAGSNRLEPSALSSKLLDTSSRQSAFHAKAASTSSEISQSNSTNAIHAL